MQSLINSNYNRSYNPTGQRNALSDIKRLLTSRDNIAQNKACGYLIEVLSRYKSNTEERARMVEYLLDNDITVFLCEATSNLDFSLFSSVLACVRLLWHSRRFFDDEHAAHASAAVLRALTHYAVSGAGAAVDTCLHFLCDLLNGIRSFKSTAALSHQSAYSTTQLLAALSALSARISTNTNSILSSALVLNALIAYQPENLDVKAVTAKPLVEVLQQWFKLLTGALNHSMLVGDGGSGIFFVVICYMGIDSIRLVKLLNEGKKQTDFVNTILIDEEEITFLKQSAADLNASTQEAMLTLVEFAKENQSQIATEEYSVFLKFLLTFFYENASHGILGDFCDLLFAKGYLTMLPQAQIVRNDLSIRKVSTLILGEMLKVLADKYLNVDTGHEDNCSKDIHMGLVELQYGIERPKTVGLQLQNSQSYSLLIYIYFYCQSSENPEEATAPLLPYLVEHILCIPKTFKLRAYIVKALWLVFAMSTISNRSLDSLEERVYLEKATDRLVAMLHPEPAVFYTHNPAILLWAFTSIRIPNYLRLHVLSQWFKSESTLPTELTLEPVVWELLLTIISQCKDTTIVGNSISALHDCIEDGAEETRQEFAGLVWRMLPGVLSKGLIDCESGIDSNLCHILDIATVLLPSDLDQATCVKIAVLITTLFSKATIDHCEVEGRHHYEYVCLKLSLLLLGLASSQDDHRVLLIYTNRAGYLPSVLNATNSANDKVACVALQLLSYVVHYFTKNNYQRKSVLQIQTHLIIKALHQDCTNERGASLLQLVYMVLNSGPNTPLAFSYNCEPIALSIEDVPNKINDKLCENDVKANTNQKMYKKEGKKLSNAMEISHEVGVMSSNAGDISGNARDISRDERDMPCNVKDIIYKERAYDEGTSSANVDSQCAALRALMFRIQLMLCCKESKNQSSSGWKTLSAIFKHAIVTKNDPKLVAILTSQPWTHTLVQFQLTQTHSQEFLSFTQNWLSLLNITLKKQREQKKLQIFKQSLVIKTLMMIKKHLVVIEDDEQGDIKKKILEVVKEIFDECGVRFSNGRICL